MKYITIFGRLERISWKEPIKGVFLFPTGPLELMQKNMSKWKVCICTNNLSFLHCLLFPDNVIITSVLAQLFHNRGQNITPLNNQF